jgi:hypothetical protein
MLACGKKHLAMINILVKNDVDLKRKNKWLLHAASIGKTQVPNIIVSYCPIA